MTDNAVLDMVLVTELQDVMADKFADLVAMFKRDGERRLTVLAEAMPQGDMDTLRACVHSLKGSSSNVGAQRLAAMCMVLEQAAAESDKDTAQACLQSLPEYFQEALAALEHLLAPSASS